VYIHNIVGIGGGGQNHTVDDRTVKQPGTATEKKFNFNVFFDSA
jgi:hypothetical protein